jgi:hypothetical protein
MRSEGSLGTRVKIDTLIFVRYPDAFTYPNVLVVIEVAAVRPVPMVPVPAMNISPMLVMVAISVPSNRNF